MCEGLRATTGITGCGTPPPNSGEAEEEQGLGIMVIIIKEENKGSTT